MLWTGVIAYHNHDMRSPRGTISAMNLTRSGLCKIKLCFKYEVIPNGVLPLYAELHKKKEIAITLVNKKFELSSCIFTERSIGVRLTSLILSPVNVQRSGDLSYGIQPVFHYCIV